MSEFTLEDFAETLERTELHGKVAECLRAWGSVGDYNEWDGGFLVRLTNGKVAYIEGWCDTTGWG